MARIFKTPFGAQGDTEQVPEAPQGDGSVSLTQGFGYDYEREYEDPAAKDIRREVMNGLFHDITEAIGDIQLSGIAKWSADAAPYPAGAIVWHNSVAWISTAGSNTTTPSEGASWTAVARVNDSRITGAAQKAANLSDLASAGAARQNLGLGSAATKDVGESAGNVMGVGAGGWLGASSTDGYMLGYPQSPAENISQIYRRDTPDGLVDEYAVSMHMASGNTWGRLRVSPFDQSAWVQGGSAANGTGWTSQVVLSDTQVIAGAGLSGGGNLTTSRTISIANSHIPIGLGQTWQDVSGSRFKNTSYTNTTGRPIYVSVVASDSGGGVAALRVDGVIVGRDDIASTEISSLGTISAIVPHGSTYIIDMGSAQSINAWAELR